jgi:hypothetical protein
MLAGEVVTDTLLPTPVGTLFAKMWSPDEPVSRITGTAGEFPTRTRTIVCAPPFGWVVTVIGTATVAGAACAVLPTLIPVATTAVAPAIAAIAATVRTRRLCDTTFSLFAANLAQGCDRRISDL